MSDDTSRDQFNHREDSRDRKRGGMSSKARGETLQGYLIHLGVYASVILFLFLLNVVTGRDTWWFIYPALAWGVGIGIHTVVTLVTLNTAKVEEWAEQPVLRRRAPRPAPASPGSSGSEIDELMMQGGVRIDDIRATARRIRDAGARQEALDVCASADRVMSALAEHPDELPLARKFLHNIVEPTEKIVTTYQRLSSRDIASARETLAQVEQHDLPLIREKMDEVYERLHRGTLIDLEVAREMLVLDLPAATAPSLTARDDHES